uniref:Uncharacterized protein n=1 Tax=Arundo donax TaxID=35708 RepID=A0A0A8ZPY5_ARUDO
MHAHIYTEGVCPHTCIQREYESIHAFRGSVHILVGVCPYLSFIMHSHVGISTIIQLNNHEGLISFNILKRQ